MKYNGFILLFLVFQNHLIHAQQKSDYVWIYGHNSEIEEGIESYFFDFNLGSTPYGDRGLTKIRISQANASICDENGNLLLYSNGCAIVGSNHEILPNGEGINEGEWVTYFRNDTCTSYSGTQDFMFLPDPSSEVGYYLIHKRAELNDPYNYRSLNYSYVDLSLNNGFGDVIRKNEPISDLRFAYDYLTAIKHANQRDWWIVQPVDQSDSLAVFLLNENGFSFQSIGTLPRSFNINSSATGTAKFSPDGNRYAIYNAYNNLMIFDFNRETGEFSNSKVLDIINVGPSDVKFSCVEWSPNSRFIYVATSDQLWQVDLFESNLEDGLELIDEWDGTQDPFATTFELAALAPDCKIYITPGGSSWSYHVINEPNLKGQACNFVQRGVKLPFLSSRSTLPNFPRFRVDEEDKCDPTITSIFGDQVFYRKDLVAFPNPVSNFINIEIPDNHLGQIYIFDMFGQLAYSQNTNGDYDFNIDLSFLSQGNYNIEFIPDNNINHLVWTKQIIKVD